ncbi:MAG: methionine adenosyltransferase [Methanosphaera sp.]|uniref:methionine adenosyltransferase n=1 Tax=Methanosphaera sp. TaxID=2666342 RepID=UPI0025EBB657|nr:methionine adenosyltransferase [Methanosphaera sp.]MCI5866881.1 methionine adenosyltransferase [Methanosphaera sp.]MDD6534388.1 methionine adenosyltransferase [Methanosphaera sp.]MDY3955207.1 methionine adenosyltransferase [Methanosphaera sp.]
MRNIKIEKASTKLAGQDEIEIVERKGIGHPDSISDGIAEAVSRTLSQAYKEKAGSVLHHNTDEVQITAGESDPKFGGGQIIKPIQILLTGRAANEFTLPNGETKKVGVDYLAIEAAKNYLKENILNLDVEYGTVVECKIGQGSADLRDVFQRPEDVPSSNDTSFGVGFYPFTETENLVLKTEELLNNKDFKKSHPQVGEDIKVMGLREKDKITLTIASAFVSRYVDDVDCYLNMKHELEDIVKDLAAKETDMEVTTLLNTADDETKKDESGYYLTVTGTSAEMGDDGSVGRGNRSNGLITPNRPMSMEATSGKNPINHVGKIYNLLSNEITKEVYQDVEGVQNIDMVILSQIGKPIDQPRTATAHIQTKDGYTIDEVEDDVTRIIDKWLENITDIKDFMLEGKLRTF